MTKAYVKPLLTAIQCLGIKPKAIDKDSYIKHIERNAI